MTLSYTPLLVLAIVALVVGLVVGGLGGMVVGYYAAPDCDCEAEYYRAIYDTWTWVKSRTDRQVNVCAMVQAMIDNDWYNQPSAGCQWPLSEPTPGPRGDEG